MIKRPDFIPAIIGFIIASLITYGVYLWTESPGVEFVQRTPSASAVKAGDLATISWREERDHSCQATVYRKLIAADNSIIEFVPEKIAVGDDAAFNGHFSFKVPVGLKSGDLVFRATLDLQCNWLQRIIGGHVEDLPDIVFSYANEGTVNQ